MKYLISIDDFCDQNIRMADLLEKWGLKGLFFIQCNSKEAIKQIKELHQRGHFIGSHTVTHSILRDISEDQAKFEIEESKRLIEQAIQAPIVWFCYPRGRYNEKIIEMVKNAGYIFARTTKLIGEGKQSHNPFEWGVHVHAFQRKEYKDWHWLDYAEDQIAKCARTGEQFEIFAHAWEVDRDYNWTGLERVFALISAQK